MTPIGLWMTIGAVVAVVHLLWALRRMDPDAPRDNIYWYAAFSIALSFGGPISAIILALMIKHARRGRR